jgi:hypothetical protein
MIMHCQVKIYCLRAMALWRLKLLLNNIRFPESYIYTAADPGDFFGGGSKILQPMNFFNV